MQTPPSQETKVAYSKPPRSKEPLGVGKGGTEVALEDVKRNPQYYRALVAHLQGLLSKVERGEVYELQDGRRATLSQADIDEINSNLGGISSMEDRHRLWDDMLCLGIAPKWVSLSKHDPPKKKPLKEVFQSIRSVEAVYAKEALRPPKDICVKYRQSLKTSEILALL